MNSTQKVIISGVVGLAAGAAAGVLLAPNDGKKTRKKIAKSAEEIKSSVEDFVEASKDAVVDMAKNGSAKETA